MKKEGKKYRNYHIGICDDGINVCSLIEDMVQRYTLKTDNKFDIDVWYTGEELITYLEQKNHIDILFLDIDLVTITGMQIASYIRNKLDDIGMQIIYISGQSDYAQQLFKTQPLDFLIKPFTQEQLDETLNNAIHFLSKSYRRIEIQKGQEFYYLSMHDIVMVESRGRKIRIVTDNGSLEIYDKLSEFSRKLSDDFMQIHHSYIVNREYVVRYTYEMVEMRNGLNLPISQANRKRVREIILKSN